MQFHQLWWLVFGVLSVAASNSMCNLRLIGPFHSWVHVPLALLGLGCFYAPAATDGSDRFAGKAPRYVVKLSPDEYSLLQAAEAEGLRRYGGSADFKLTLAKEGNEITWTVAIESPRLMELVGIFVGEKTVKVVQGLDANSINPSERIQLTSIKTLSQKLDYALKNPVWDRVTLSGSVLAEGTNWFMQTGDEKLRLVGAKLPELQRINGAPIVARGWEKAPGQFEPVSYLERRLNTLELFVMSQCPYGQSAQTKLLSYIASTNCVQKPKLEVHYIFYKQQRDGKEVFWSLHGEEEIVEDLVQMVLRDRYPLLFEHYLLKRSTNPSVPWRELLEQAGVSNPILDEVETAITVQREALLQAEYNYVAGVHGIYDGSPTYVWESERVSDLSRLPPFTALKAFTGEACSK